VSAKSQVLNQNAKPTVTGAVNDTLTPLSFQVWYKTRQGIVPEKEYEQYNNYLLDWYKNKSTATVTSKEQLRLNYLKLLRQLQIFLTSEETENWYNNVNLDNEKELLLSIPYFAKKLRDISMYYVQLRENVKQSRIKYNLAGTGASISQELYRFLLNKFTKDTTGFVEIPSYVWQTIPALSSVKNTIKFEIEELYDTHNYLDHSPTVPVSDYYDLNNIDLQNFLTTKNLEITSSNWIYKTGTHTLLNDPNLSGTDIPNLQYDVLRKYLGQEKYTTTTYPSQSTVANLFEVAINTGNNFFYWPNGPYSTNILNLPRFELLPLTSTNIETFATGGSSLELADTIFVKTAKEIQGAWLKNTKFTSTPVNLTAKFNYNKKTIFRYPFPGFGLSAEDVDWTGYSFTPTYQFTYLPNNIQKAIENVYWSTNFTSVSTTNSLPINTTTLIEQGAHADKNYTHADKVRTWTTPPEYNNTAYSGDINEAWLYRFNNTEISLKPGQNRVFWPYGAFNVDTITIEAFPENFSDVCAPVSLSSIEWRYATASDTLSTADTLYKLINLQDNIEDAVECYWLSGNTVTASSDTTTCVSQPSLNLICKPGTFTNFIWLGPDNTSIDTVFANYKHTLNCEYFNTSNKTFRDHPLCTCRQVQFTPFGHPGTNFTDKNGHCDFIIEDSLVNRYFDINTWRDADNLDSTTSEKFAWYQTKDISEFGNGNWITTSTSSSTIKFKLKHGKMYRYYRAKPRTADTNSNQFPYLVIRYDYNNWPQAYGKQFVWTKAFKSPDNNNWYPLSGVANGDTTISPGDILLYDRKDTNTFTVTGTFEDYTKVIENRGSLWSSYDYITVDPYDLTTISISVPRSGQTQVLYPPHLSGVQAQSQLPSIPSDYHFQVKQWRITHEYETGQFADHYFKETPSVTLIPAFSGTYFVSVTALTATNDFNFTDLPISPTAKFKKYLKTINPGMSGYWVFDRVPPITAVAIPRVLPTLSAVNHDIPGYVLTTPLFGWNYNLNSYDGVSNGAKPFWATGITEKNTSTKFKGVESWGTPTRIVDEHNVITMPLYSTLTLEAGNYFEYNRVYTTDLLWNQQITLNTLINQNTWCALSVNTNEETNFASFVKNYNQDVSVVATTAASPIQLSNFINEEPVEVYYNALRPFVWSVTCTPVLQPTTVTESSASRFIEPISPWVNLGNQFYPTIAHASTLEDVYSKYDLGGFFTPDNLGISTFLTKDYTVTTSLCTQQLSGVFENKNKKVGGRGFTKEEQQTPYSISFEDSTWLKQTVPGSPATGNINPQIFKKHQKFIPYTSLNEVNSYSSLGLVTPTSKQSPWTGTDDSEWGDAKNYPINFNSELNVEKWVNDQVLKQNKLRIDNWVTDIYGNQYGLYKNLSGVPARSARDVSGEIWVRKKNQSVEPSYKALKDVFENYKYLNIYSDLTGSGVKKIDTFFESLYIETEKYIIFEKINYDFNTSRIYSSVDNSRVISLDLPVQTNLKKDLSNNEVTINTVYSKPGDTWFFPDKKEVCVSVCGVSGNNIYPEVYKLNLIDLTFNKIFPVESQDITTLNELSSLSITSIQSPVLSHNTLLNEYILSVHGFTDEQKMYLIEIAINDLETHTLKNITIYNSLLDPLLPPSLEYVPFTTATLATTTTYQITNSTLSSTFTQIANIPEIPDGIIDSNGLFTGTPAVTGIHEIPFTLSNLNGATYYTLTINTTA
jgi:hypothetical protein